MIVSGSVRCMIWGFGIDGALVKYDGSVKEPGNRCGINMVTLSHQLGWLDHPGDDPM